MTKLFISVKLSSSLFLSLYVYNLILNREYKGTFDINKTVNRVYKGTFENDNTSKYEETTHTRVWCKTDIDEDLMHHFFLHEDHFLMWTLRCFFFFFDEDQIKL